jgi:multicomponent Na+:H+ antiporter subunit E
VRSTIALFVVLMAVWLLNSGHYTPMMIGFGVGSCVFVVWLSRRMGIVDDEALPVRLIPRALLYVPWLIKEVFTANVDVARRVLTPGKLDISPKLFHAKTTQASDLGRVIYANSITLTPGTVSVLVHGRSIWVHAIAEEVAEGLMEGEMERRVTRLEGLGNP